jgi:hypothetical protein
MDRFERGMEQLKEQHEALAETVEIIAGMQRKNEEEMTRIMEAIRLLSDISRSQGRRLDSLEGQE